MHQRRIFLICVTCAFVLACWGCAREQAPTTSQSRDDAEGFRIVSLSPAMTRIAADLGFGEFIVGRTPWCTAVDETVPVVGDLMDIDYETLTRLRPTHVFIQPAQGGVPAEVQTLADERGWQVTSVHLDSVAEIGDALDAVANVLSVTDSPISDDHAARHRALQTRMASLTAEPDEVAADREPVLLLYMNEPPSVFGAGTYLNDVLHHLGYANATEARGWAQLTLEDLTRINPSAILFIQPNAAADVDVMRALGPVGKLDVAAVRDGKVAVIRHPDALLPSTSVIEVAAEMRAALDGWNFEMPSGG